MPDQGRPGAVPGLRLYDSLSRSIAPLEPLRPGSVGVYVCGPTPQAPPHVGHMRAAVVYDVLRRWLEHTGVSVTLIRNVTDIDDKILVKSAERGEQWWAHAYRFEREFGQAYDALRVLPPTYEPRATGHVPEMVGLMERLIDAGHAYVVPGEPLDAGSVAGTGAGAGTAEGAAARDATADVYFDVRSWPAYGELTRQRLDDVAPSEDTDPALAHRKRDPRDFALWKGSKAGEPGTARWPTPWGWGRPGWHLECSAMAGRYLGAEFDIHGGGLDLRFPHHENELAQSRAAGDGFARVWMHNALVTASGEKMSKSLGNSMLVSALLTQVAPEALRYYLLSAHYRSTLEFGQPALDDAAAAWQRIASVVQRASDRLGADATAPRDSDEVPAEFAAAMADDLAVPAALAVLHGAVRDANSALAAGDETALAAAVRSVLSMSRVLGIEPGPADQGDGRALKALDALVRGELDARAQARAGRDFAAADAIRDRLTAAGIAVEDTADGARWTVGD